MDATVCEEYLRNKIIYDLGEQELEGMTLFQQLCRDQGLIPQKHEIRFVGN